MTEHLLGPQSPEPGSPLYEALNSPLNLRAARRAQGSRTTRRRGTKVEEHYEAQRATSHVVSRVHKQLRKAGRRKNRRVVEGSIQFEPVATNVEKITAGHYRVFTRDASVEVVKSGTHWRTADWDSDGVTHATMKEAIEAARNFLT